MQNLDLDPDQAYHSDLMTVREAVRNEMEGTVLSGHKNVEFGPLMAVTSITILGTDGPWEVGWEIRLPFEPPILEVQEPQVTPLTVSMPDLTPISCTVTPESPTEADEVLIEIVVENAGDAVADFPRSASGHTILRADGSPIQHFDRASGWLIEPGDTGVWESGLMPNSHPPGTLEFKAVIDPQNRVGESNEDNNEILCPAVVVRTETDPPDLTITALTLDPPEATRQNGFAVRATVANIGGRDAVINGISLVLFGGPYTNLVYPPREGGFRLGPGESQVFEMIPTERGVEPGTTTWTIEVDPGDQVRESDETNNQKEITVTVAR